MCRESSFLLHTSFSPDGMHTKAKQQNEKAMNTVKIYRLPHLSHSLFQRLKAAQMEAARVWNRCCELHKEARQTHSKWPDRDELEKATKRQFALSSQSVQMVVHAFLANIDTTQQLRQTNPKMKYPYKEKRFYPVMWPAQAIYRHQRHIVLPMGRGNASLILPLTLPDNSGACRLVWNNGFELHVCIEVVQAKDAPGENRATVDLGEIHLAAVTTTTGKALVVSGRGIRSLKRERNKKHGQLARKQARCQKYSRRWKKLQHARNTMRSRNHRRVRDLRHKATRQVINFCVQEQVGTLFVGNPHGVRKRKSGRHHNQRMSQWEYGKDISYLTHKSKQAHIMCFTGSERGTSSQCPVCGHRHKPKNRVWKCQRCGFIGHRDVVGSINMHTLAYNNKVMFPRSITYLRPGLSRCSSRAGTPQAS